jgi:DNA modification methylase
MISAKRRTDDATLKSKFLSHADIADRLFVGHSAKIMETFPGNSIDLIVTSPPYWTAVEYDQGVSPWKEDHADKGENVRGFIISREVDSKLKYAAKAVPLGLVALQVFQLQR